MKKTIVTLALVVAIGFTGISLAQAAFFGPGACNGPGGLNGKSSFTYEDMEKFHNDNAELRRELFEKRTEYYKAINQETPDKALAKTLWSEIYDLQNEMHEKALKTGMMRGYGNFGNYGGGHMMGF